MVSTPASVAPGAHSVTITPWFIFCGPTCYAPLAQIHTHTIFCVHVSGAQVPGGRVKKSTSGCPFGTPSIQVPDVSPMTMRRPTSRDRDIFCPRGLAKALETWHSRTVLGAPCRWCPNSHIPDPGETSTDCPQRAPAPGWGTDSDRYVAQVIAQGRQPRRKAAWARRIAAAQLGDQDRQAKTTAAGARLGLASWTLLRRRATDRIAAVWRSTGMRVAGFYARGPRRTPCSGRLRRRVIGRRTRVPAAPAPRTQA